MNVKKNVKDAEAVNKNIQTRLTNPRKLLIYKKI